MPTRKRSTTTRRKKHGMRGRGIADSIMSGLRYIKDKQLLSKGLSLIPHPGAQAVSTLAGLVGLGRKKRKAVKSKRVSTRRLLLAMHAPKRVRSRRTSQRGRGIFSDLGGGIGNVFGGLGSGLGSFSHGLFGGGRPGMRSMHMAMGVRPGMGIRL